jgi:FtsP/CotA-like multicopper oxidase with cupredoxin domain
VDYSALFYADLAVAVLVAAAVGAALHGALTGHPVTGRIRLLLAVALALVALRLVMGMLLARYGWEFASRQLTYQLPMVAIPVAGALLVAMRSPLDVGARAGAAIVMSAAAAAGAASLAVVDGLLLPSPATAAWLTALAILGPPLGWLAISGTGVSPTARPVVRTVAVAVPALGLVAGIGTAWWSSRLPGRYDLADYAVMDIGGAPSGEQGDHDHSGSMSVTDLTGPRTGEPDVRYTLTASPKDVTTASGRAVRGFAFNGSIPGPRLEAHQGDLVEVTVRNAGVKDGLTIHWHGVNVPNAEDGVAGVTQDAVADGESYTYRFRIEQIGTFWYHSHQTPAVQIDHGLFGAFVVLPREADQPGDGTDLAVVDHAWRPPDGFAPGGRWEAATRVERHRVAPGTPVRLRLVNTDSVPHRYGIAGVPYKLVAIDGTDVVGPTEVTNKSLLLAAGGRYDVTFAMPAGGQAVTLSGLGENVRMVLGDGPPASNDSSARDLDLISYGSPAPTAIDRDGSFTRDFRMVMDRKIGFLDGQLGYQWAVNGELFPRMPMFMVTNGDTVRVTFVNRSTAHHPMHLHGHHALVLTRNGTAATGSPWWTDTLNVAPGETYEVAFLADNPGVWMDHCHDLNHAADGFVMHLGYEGVTTPYGVGDDTGNVPE